MNSSGFPQGFLSATPILPHLRTAIRRSQLRCLRLSPKDPKMYLKKKANLTGTGCISKNGPLYNILRLKLLCFLTICPSFLKYDTRPLALSLFS